MNKHDKKKLVIRLERWGVYYYEKNIGFFGIGDKALANLQDYGGRVTGGDYQNITYERDQYNCKTNQIIFEMPQNYQAICYYEFAYHHYDDGNQYTYEAGRSQGKRKRNRLISRALYEKCGLSQSQYYRRRDEMLDNLKYGIDNFFGIPGLNAKC